MHTKSIPDSKNTFTWLGAHLSTTINLSARPGHKNVSRKILSNQLKCKYKNIR